MFCLSYPATTAQQNFPPILPIYLWDGGIEEGYEQDKLGKTIHCTIYIYMYIHNNTMTVMTEYWQWRMNNPTIRKIPIE